MNFSSLFDPFRYFAVCQLKHTIIEMNAVYNIETGVAYSNRNGRGTPQ